ncbi:MAG: hypothetical protein JO218_18865, partial [Burkholderiales bacterium]|nr:hypothetical protein [Burkholderiales bacterium]
MKFRPLASIALLPLVVSLSSCFDGGSSGSSPSASVKIEVFGARGDTLIAQTSGQNCTAPMFVQWKTLQGVVLAVGDHVVDPAPDQTLTAAASCGGANSSVTVDQRRIYSSSAAFALLKTDGTVAAWGHPIWGGNSSSVAAKLVGVSKLAGSERSFAAVLGNGNVVTWGSTLAGGDSSVTTSPLTGVTAVWPGRLAFLATKSDGTVSLWGNGRVAFDPDGATYTMTDSYANTLTGQITTPLKWVSNESLFTVLNTDGTTAVWGDAGLVPGVAPYALDPTQLSNVVDVVANRSDIALLH